MADEVKQMIPVSIHKCSEYTESLEKENQRLRKILTEVCDNYNDDWCKWIRKEYLAALDGEGK